MTVGSELMVRIQRVEGIIILETYFQGGLENGIALT